MCKINFNKAVKTKIGDRMERYYAEQFTRLYNIAAKTIDQHRSASSYRAARRNKARLYYRDIVSF